jgi:predicted hotdog family 3-hydroxylacyl-ACP dehydratase
MWMADEDVTLEGLGTGVARARTGRRPGLRIGALPAWVRDRLATTPGRLVLVSILVVVGAVCFGAIATGAEQSRERAAKSARLQTEPLLVQAKNLYTSLSDANATVATGLLSGGVETAANRNRYLGDLATASGAVSTLTRAAGTAGNAPAALATIANQLPTYSGLIETARTNNGLGFPVGAAYVRAAAALMTSHMLPAAEHLYTTEAERLNDDYHTGSATSTIVTFAAASALAVVLLLLAQAYVARISRRILNVPMVVATVAVAAVSVWGIVGLVSAQSALKSSERNGSDSVEALSAATVLLSRAEGDLSLAIVNRGTDTADPNDFQVVKRVLERPGGVIAEISALAQRAGTTGAAQRFDSEYAAYQARTDQLTRLEDSGQLTNAIGLAPQASAISEELSLNLAQQIDAAQGRFKHEAANATSSFDGLAFAIPLITVLAAVLALIGLRERINEYR